MPKVGVNPPILFNVSCLVVAVALIVVTTASETSTICVFLLKISTVSPSFKFDLSKSDLRTNVEPLILSIWNLHEVL